MFKVSNHVKNLVIQMSHLRLKYRKFCICCGPVRNWLDLVKNLSQVFRCVNRA
jgi:hypothetical protein